MPSAVNTPLKQLIQGQTQGKPFLTEPLQQMTWDAEHGIDPVDVGIDMALGGGISKVGRAGAGMAMRGGRALQSGLKGMMERRAASMPGAMVDDLGSLPSSLKPGPAAPKTAPWRDPPSMPPAEVDPPPLPNLPPSPSPDFGEVYGKVPLDTKKAVDAAFDQNPERMRRVWESRGGMDEHVGSIHGSMERERMSGSPVGQVIEEVLAQNPEMRAKLNTPESLEAMVEWAKQTVADRAKYNPEFIPPNSLVQDLAGAGNATRPGFSRKAASPTLRDMLGGAMVSQSLARR